MTTHCLSILPFDLHWRRDVFTLHIACHTHTATCLTTGAHIHLLPQYFHSLSCIQCAYSYSLCVCRFRAFIIGSFATALHRFFAAALHSRTPFVAQLVLTRTPFCLPARRFSLRTGGTAPLPFTFLRVCGFARFARLDA